MTGLEIADLAQSLLRQSPGVYAGKLSVTYEDGRLMLSEYRPGGDGWELVGALTDNPQYITGWCDDDGYPRDCHAEAVIMRTVAEWIRDAGRGKTQHAAGIARDIERDAMELLRK